MCILHIDADRVNPCSTEDLRPGAARSAKTPPGGVEDPPPPAPLAAVGRVPPGPEDAHLTARKDHRPADVVRLRPPVPARDPLTIASQPRHRPAGRALEPVA